MVLRNRKLLVILMTLFMVSNLLLATHGFAQEMGSVITGSTAHSFNEDEIVPGKVLVKYKQQASIKNLQSLSVHPDFASSWTTLSFSNDLSVADKIAELQKDPTIEYVEPVYRVHLIPSEVSSQTVSEIVYSGDDSYMQHWGKLAAHVDDMSTYATPSQKALVTVAVIDTGVDMSHPDLLSSLITGRNFINTQNPPQDDNGHGTHVSGIIAAQSQGNLQIGVAPGVKIMPLKVLNSEGKGDTSLLVDAIQYAIDNHVDLINMSLGLGGDSKALHEIIKLAHAQHIVIISASGNESNHWINTEPGQMDIPTGSDTHRYARYTDYPAAYDEVISVGAVAQLPDLSYAIADFSNVGKVDVVAPGVNIYSTTLNGNYKYLSGTSQATPFVTGLAALIKAANKNLDEEDIRNILQTSASKYQSSLLSLKLNGNINSSIPYTIFNSAPVSYSAAYGDGLIDGIRAFQIPRLKITPAPGGGNYPANPNVTYDVSLVDIQNNTVVTATYMVALEARAYNETSYDRVGDGSYTLGTFSSGQLQNGKVRLTAAFNTNNPVHHIYIHGLWSEPVLGGTTYPHHSNSYTFLGLPSKPIISLAPGTYVGEKTVTITSPYQEGSIYVEVNTKDDSKYTYLNYFGGSLKISENTLLTVATLVNNVFSEDANYFYTITAPPVISGGGGGGGGGSSQSPPSLNKDGKMSYNFTPPHVDLLIGLNADSKELTLNAKTKENLDILTVEVDSDIVRIAGQRSKSIVVNSNDLTVKIPPQALAIKQTDGKIIFTASKETAPTMTSFTAASSIYDFSIAEDEENLGVFKTPVQVTLPYDKSKVKDTHNLSLYTFDTKLGTWTPVEGTFNADGTITASLPHFSKYAVLEKKSVLTDIQNHWAQKEIEELAGKQIIDGMDDNTFQPNTTMTRAQFVTMLTKALKLQDGENASMFTDVASSAWYKSSVYAAFKAGIISGLNDQTFSPDTSITREQMAVIMVNTYLHATGKKLEDLVTTQEVKYTDEGSISPWARTSVRLASALGLLSGTGEGQFAPADATTRAQAAVVLYRLLSKIQ